MCTKKSRSPVFFPHNYFSSVWRQPQNFSSLTNNLGSFHFVFLNPNICKLWLTCVPLLPESPPRFLMSLPKPWEPEPDEEVQAPGWVRGEAPCSGRCYRLPHLPRAFHSWVTMPGTLQMSLEPTASSFLPNVLIKLQSQGCALLSHSVMPDSFATPWTVASPALSHCTWDSLGKDAGVGCHALLLQGIFPT